MSYEITVTPAMIEAGVERLRLLKEDVGSAYLVEEIFRAMAEVDCLVLDSRTNAALEKLISSARQ